MDLIEKIKNIQQSTRVTFILDFAVFNGFDRSTGGSR